MTTMMHPAVATRAASYYRPARAGVLEQALIRVRRSRSLASMLPAVLSSGVMTLVITAVMHLMWAGMTDGFAGRWMESWLTAWPIAFPVAYLVVPALVKLAARLAAPAAHRQAIRPGLAFDDIQGVSTRVTAYNRLPVLRNLKPATDFSAV